MFLSGIVVLVLSSILGKKELDSLVSQHINATVIFETGLFSFLALFKITGIIFEVVSS